MVKIDSVSEIFILALKMMKKWFLVLGKNLHFYEASENNFPHGGISKNKFLNHFSSSVGNFMYRFILTMKTIVEFFHKIILLYN